MVLIIASRSTSGCTYVCMCIYVSIGSEGLIINLSINIRNINKACISAVSRHG